MDNQIYEFGPFQLIPDERQLLREGSPLVLPPKAFDLLLVLVRNNGHVMKKDDLLRTVWPDAFVEENNLNQYVSLLRKTLSNGSDGEHYIETVRRLGFRFAADVHEAGGQTVSVAVHKRTRSHLVIREETQERIIATGQETAVAPSTSNRGRGAAAVWRKSGVLALTSVGLAGLAVGAYFLLARQHIKRPPASPVISSMAVLPFISLGAHQSDDDYLGLGLADSLITRLGQIRQLSVRPTGAIIRYGESARDAGQIGRELGVDAVMDGRFQRSGDQIRITAQLINVEDRTLLWTGQFDKQLTDLLAVQDAISEQAAQAMKLQMSAWERERLGTSATSNPEANQYYLKGRFFWNKRTADSFNKAIGCFQQAINLDHEFALAYAGLADCYNLLSEYNGASPAESFAASKKAANRALEIDDSLAEAHTALAYVLLNYECEWNGAEREFKRALELNPNYATAHLWYSEYLWAMGRLDEHQAELARAMENDPLSLIINAEQGLMFIETHQYDRAIEHFQKAIELDPNFAMAHANLRSAYELSGQPDKAVHELLTVITLNGNSPGTIASLKRAYDCCGMYGVWRWELAFAQKQRRAGYFSPYAIAMDYARLGDNEQALSWLEQAYSERDRFMIFLRQGRDIQFAAVRSDPRFGDLLVRMHLSS